MVAVVGCVDQAAKAWAWRNLAPAHVNTGGDMLVGPVVSGWFRDRATGTVFDLLDAALLVSIGALLVRRRRPPTLLGGGALALAGWASNLTDRLGLHLLTAPGSGRGVVDFLPWQRRYWNLADLAITAGTAVFGLALIWHAARLLATRPRPPRPTRPAQAGRPLRPRRCRPIRADAPELRFGTARTRPVPGHPPELAAAGQPPDPNEADQPANAEHLPAAQTRAPRRAG